MTSLSAQAREGVRALSPYEPGKPIDELKRELGLTSVIKLASNENPLGPSARALSALHDAVAELARYPDGGGALLRAKLARRHGVECSQVTLGNGSNDVLELAARAFAGPGDEIVFAQHAFAVYPIVTRAVGAAPREIPARGLGHDLEAMAAAVNARTRVVFLANPNNPTGTWFTRAALEAFLARVPADVLVVLDEAYFEYVTEPEYPNGVTLVARYPNLLVTRTFSKIYGLAGLRIGYGVSSPEVAGLLNRVRQPFNVNSLALAAAEAALDDDAHLARSRGVNTDGMRGLVDGVKALGLDYLPSVGNFVCVEVGDAARVYRELLTHGVIVRPIANYGMPRYLRVTVGLPEENVRFLAALAAVLRE